MTAAALKALKGSIRKRPKYVTSIEEISAITRLIREEPSQLEGECDLRLFLLILDVEFIPHKELKSNMCVFVEKGE